MLKLCDNEANTTLISIQTLKQAPDLTAKQTSCRSGYGC